MSIPNVNSGRPSVEGSGFVGSWNRFWFQPTDPTTLGFMRIITGLVVIYIHLAYCFDFQAFFGANAWIDLQTVDKERKETPWAVGPWDYTEWRPKISLPDRNDPKRREAVIRFMADLPESQQERARALAFLARTTDPNINFGRIRYFLQTVGGLTAEQKQRLLTRLQDPMLRPDDDELPVTLPEWFINLPPSLRLNGWQETLAFLSVLPDSQVEGLTPEQRQEANERFEEIMFWLEDLQYYGRSRALWYLTDNKDFPAEREKRLQHLAYLDFWNYDPTDVYAKGRYIFSIWFHVTDPTMMAIIHAMIICCFVLFTLGLWTRTTSVLSWLGALCYIHRNNNVLFGMDTMMNILLFYLMIGPSGAALSLDRLRTRRRAAQALLLNPGKRIAWAEAALAGPVPSRMANLVIRLVQIHFCIIYMSSGLSKLKGTMWWTTDSNWFTIANPEFSLMHYELYQQLMRFIAASRPLLMVILGILNYGTLVLEISLPYLVWTRLRPYMVIGAILLHSGIAFVMGLTAFGLLMMTLLLSYFPASVIRERLCWAPGSGPRLTVRFNSQNRTHVQTVSGLLMFDVANQLQLVDEAGKGEGVAADTVQLAEGNGPGVSGVAILTKATESLVLLRSVRWLLWIPGLKPLLRWGMGLR